jgi:predicted phosphodiesterase
VNKNCPKVNEDNQQIYSEEEVKDMKERGLYKNPEGDFESESEIKRKLALEGQMPPIIEGVKFPKKFGDYAKEAQERSDRSKEFSTKTEGKVKIKLPNTSIVSFIGDVHAGHPNTDYERLEQEVEVIENTPDSFVVFNGDLVEGIHWGGASQGENVMEGIHWGGASQGENVMSLDEQHGFLRSMFKKLSGKVLAGISGEHDSKWAAKTGSDPYSQFTEMSNAPYIRGIAELDVDVGEQNYKLVAGHRFRGHSMYSPVHPPNRMSKFHLQDADVYVSGHTHRKGVSQEAIRTFDGSREVTYGSTGSYKSGDEYGERSGFVSSKKREMGGLSIRLRADKKKVDIDTDIVEAHKKWWQR